MTLQISVFRHVSFISFNAIKLTEFVVLKASYYMINTTLRYVLKEFLLQLLCCVDRFNFTFTFQLSFVAGNVLTVYIYLHVHSRIHQRFIHPAKIRIITSLVTLPLLSKS